MSFDRCRLGRFLPALILLAVVLATLAACGPSLTPEAQPSPVVILLQHTPALNTLRANMNTCMGDLPGAGLVVQERSAASLIPAEVDVSLVWDMRGDLPAFTAVIGQEGLAIVAHPQNPRDTIALADLQSIYTGGLREWPEPGTLIVPFAYPAGDDVQLVFESVILAGSVVPDRITYTAPDPASVIEAVSANPNAVGFVPRRWISEQVKELSVEGIEPDRLTRPLVALAESEPSGPARDWLLCLQNRLNE